MKNQVTILVTVIALFLLASCDKKHDICGNNIPLQPRDSTNITKLCDTTTVPLTNVIINRTDTVLNGVHHVKTDTVFQTITTVVTSCGGHWTTTTYSNGGSSVDNTGNNGGPDITPAPGCEWHLVANPCSGGCVVDQNDPLFTTIVEEKPSAWNNGFISAWTATGRTLQGVFLSQNTVNQITASNFAQNGRSTLWFNAFSSANNAYIIDNVSSVRQQ